MKVHCVAFLLVIVGAVNWLLVGLGGIFGGNWNLVTMLLGSWPMVESIVYVLVGVSGVYLICSHKKDCKHCDGSAPQM